MLAFATRVVDVASVGKNFKRVTFAGADLAHFGAGDAPLDLRIKLMIPPAPVHGAAELENAAGAELPGEFSSLRPGALLAEDEASGWYRRWLALPEGERGSMRTYTARALRPAGHRDNRGAEPEIDIDFVLHLRTEGGRLTGGPATVWAAQAQLGDELLILGPNSALCDASYGGIEFRPGTATRILLAGDETAAPAICSILESLPAGITGHALIEVPTTEDIQGSSTRSGVSVQWLPRGSHPHGELLASAVRSAVAIPAAGAVVTGAEPGGRRRRRDDPVGNRDSLHPAVLRLAGGGGRHDQGAAPLPGARCRHGPQAGRVHGLLAPRQVRGLASGRNADGARCPPPAGGAAARPVAYPGCPGPRGSDRAGNYIGPSWARMRASSARSFALSLPKYCSVWPRRAARTRSESFCPAGVSLTRVARRSTGSAARCTIPLASSWSMTSVADRGAMCRRSATSLSRSPSPPAESERAAGQRLHGAELVRGQLEGRQLLHPGVPKGPKCAVEKFGKVALCGGVCAG